MANLLALTAICIIFGYALSIPTEDLKANETVIAPSEVAKSEVAISEAATSEATTSEVAPAENEKMRVNGTDDDDDIANDGWEFENTTQVDTRRILYSKTVKAGARPYMVYLQLTQKSAKAHKYRGWLCAGVIVDRFYVMTSAACVEDAEHFYIISGTTKFIDSFDFKKNQCVCKNRRKVIWKCIPKNYKFDFQDSIKWTANDIAIVKVNKAFKFGVVEKGCQFATDLVCYNNVSRELEQAGTKGFIAGWGSGNTFREGVYRRDLLEDEEVTRSRKGGRGGKGGGSKVIPIKDDDDIVEDSNDKNKKIENAKCLQEAKVCIMDNEECAKKWAQKFRDIITQYMICTKDVMKRLSEICDKKYANCTDLESRRQQLIDPEAVDLGRHLRQPDDYTARRALTGGFCENDHGGPLIVKYKGKERVVGIISACKIDPKSHSCHGPFLYTSVFRNRQFISCAIKKDVEDNCRRVFRTGITHEEFTVDWRSVDKEEEGENDADEKDDNDDGDDDGEADNKKDDSAEESDEDDAKKEKKEKKTKVVQADEERKRRKREDVLYESSRNENLNEPGDE